MSDPTTNLSAAADERFLHRLERAPVRQRPELLMNFLREQIARRLDLDASEVDPRRQLMALGMSSLNAVELNQQLESELELRLRSSLIFDYPTLEMLVPFLLQRLGFSGESTPSEPVPQPRQHVAGDECITQTPPSAPSDDIAASLAAELDDLLQGR